MARAIVYLMAAVIFFLTSVMVLSSLGMDPINNLKGALRGVFASTQEQVDQKVKEKADPRALSLNIWHPSFGRDGRDTMALIGVTVLNYQRESKKNLTTIFEQGLAEISEAMVKSGKTLWREMLYVEWVEVRKHGKLEYAQQVAHALNADTYVFPPDVSALLKRCSPTKFVRARKGTLIKGTVSGGEDELRASIRAELGNPIHISEGTEFYGKCSS